MAKVFDFEGDQGCEDARLTLSAMDYWRLADELSVIDAAILIVGGNPSETSIVYDQENGMALYDPQGQMRTVQRTDYDGYDATFKALRNAIFTNRLAATLAFDARDAPRYNRRFYEDEDGSQIEVAFDVLLRASNYQISLFSNRQLSTLKNATVLFVIREPNWRETTVNVADLKAWLSEKGLKPSFFFPQGHTEGFRDQNHPRYSAKLATAVAAWEAIAKPNRNVSVKATVEAWVKANGVVYGLSGKDGIPSTKAVEEISAVVNWNTAGGANPTGGPKVLEDVEIKAIQNFSRFTTPARELPDEEIPF